MNLPPWRPANNGGGKRMWFLIRDNELSVPLGLRYHVNVNGDLIRYKSMGTAQKAADKLNEAERTKYDT